MAVPACGDAKPHPVYAATAQCTIHVHVDVYTGERSWEVVSYCPLCTVVRCIIGET